MDDHDIWLTAKALVDQLDDAASIHAAMRADELLDGVATLQRVIDAVRGGMTG